MPDEKLATPDEWEVDPDVEDDLDAIAALEEEDINEPVTVHPVESERPDDSE